MGAEASKTYINFEIPSSLRSVNPFLQLAQQLLINIHQDNTAKNVASLKKLTISCINRSFNLLSILNVDLDQDNRTCLENFRTIRDYLLRDIYRLNETNGPAGGGVVSAIELATIEQQQSEYLPEKLSPQLIELRKYYLSLSPHAPETILFEADEILALAEEFKKESFKDYASDQYHTAAIYFRVMESMIDQQTYSNPRGAGGNSNVVGPSLLSKQSEFSTVSQLQQKILYAAFMNRKCSKLQYNISGEYFLSKTCSDVYDINGSMRLGKGSYGSVYLACHKLTADDRAVKVMNVEKVTSYYLRKLHTEIDILKNLDHPNIIHLQDVYFGRRSVYIVTHVCKGGELFDLLNSGKSKGFVFKENRAALLVRDMLSAIHYLHSYCSIVHRDLKLENFLFEQQHIDSPLMLIDFGLAKKFEKGERMKQKVGSCYYTAPEVLNGDYDETCDVWSVGVLCYMIVSGSPPFGGDSPNDVYLSIMKDEAQYPSRKFGHLSPYCLDFLKRLLTKSPANRISSKEALVHPFITFHCQTNFEPFSKPLTVHQINTVVSCMSVYLSSNFFLQLLLYIIAYTLPSDIVNDMRQEFYAIDTDHSGTISYAEFYSMFSKSIYVTSGEFDLKQAFQVLCQKSGNISSSTSSTSTPPASSGGAAALSAIKRRPSINSSNSNMLITDNEITYRVYLAATIPTRVVISPERIQSIFLLLDPEGQGYLTHESIKKYLGDSVNDEDIQSMIETVYNYYHTNSRQDSKLADSKHSMDIQSQPSDAITQDMFFYYLFNSGVFGDFFTPVVTPSSSHQLQQQQSSSRFAGSSSSNPSPASDSKLSLSSFIKIMNPFTSSSSQSSPQNQQQQMRQQQQLPQPSLTPLSTPRAPIPLDVFQQNMKKFNLTSGHISHNASLSVKGGPMGPGAAAHNSMSTNVDSKNACGMDVDDSKSTVTHRVQFGNYDI